MLFNVVCAVVWSIWKHRNDLCFNSTVIYTSRNLILQIVSLVSYWTGTVKQEVREATQQWLPQDIDVIPLQVLDPDDVLMLDWVTGEDDE